jgi:molybdopterin-guanine dinucleotide biosynthesis protein A
MGRDKALVLWDGIPMVQRVYTVARSLRQQAPQTSQTSQPMRSIILSAWNDRYANLDLPGCEFLDDHQPGSGPLIALDQAMQALVSSRDRSVNSTQKKATQKAAKNLTKHPTNTGITPENPQPQAPEWILLLACDLPSLDRDHLAQLCDRVTHCDRRTLAIVPGSDGAWEPLCALYRLTAQASLRQFIETGGRSFQHWFKQLATEDAAIDTVAIAAQDRAWLRNCNTPADLP